jgi:hypothetical protein
MKALFLTLLGMSFSISAVATTQVTTSIPKPKHIGFTHTQKPTDDNATYQIGAEWGKKPVTRALMASSPVIDRQARATAEVAGVATGFYLGLFNGKHLMATNHHVCPMAYDCLNKKAVFPFLNDKQVKSFKIIEFYGSWDFVDLSIFAIEVTDPADEDALAKVGSNFAFHKEITHGEELVTMGFGIANNPNDKMMLNQDSDCKVFSANDEFRLLGDPDTINPADYKAWSFSNGCDVSHGDSGSAMVDRTTGEIVGIIWTGVMPKNPIVQNADFMTDLFINPSEEVWKELSLSVPAPKIYSEMSQYLETATMSQERKETLLDWLAH